MDKKYRDTVLKMYSGGLSPQRIAEIFFCGISTIKKILRNEESRVQNKNRNREIENRNERIVEKLSSGTKYVELQEQYDIKREKLYVIKRETCKRIGKELDLGAPIEKRNQEILLCLSQGICSAALEDFYNISSHTINRIRKRDLE